MQVSTLTDPKSVRIHLHGGLQVGGLQSWATYLGCGHAFTCGWFFFAWILLFTTCTQFWQRLSELISPDYCAKYLCHQVFRYCHVTLSFYEDKANLYIRGLLFDMGRRGADSKLDGLAVECPLLTLVHVMAWDSSVIVLSFLGICNSVFRYLLQLLSLVEQDKVRWCSSRCHWQCLTQDANVGNNQHS